MFKVLGQCLGVTSRPWFTTMGAEREPTTAKVGHGQHKGKWPQAQDKARSAHRWERGAAREVKVARGTKDWRAWLCVPGFQRRHVPVPRAPARWLSGDRNLASSHDRVDSDLDAVASGSSGEESRK